MSDTAQDPEAGVGVAAGRAVMTGIGALAGLSIYLFIDYLPDLIENPRVLAFLLAATVGFFATLLAAMGPLRLPQALLAAAVAALPGAGLFFWAGFRFAKHSDFLQSVHPVAALAGIVVIAAPFLIALMRPGEGWRHYPALFTHAWNITVRYLAAWVFTGLFWGVLMLSNELLGLVGLDLIEDLIDIDPVPYVLTGAVLGLAMAVVMELADYVSPYLILRLMRLLLPLVLVITLIFLAALPFQGLSDLFGNFSAAGTLMAMAAGIATLISCALDQRDADAARARALTWSAQILALALPVLAALSVYAVYLRVAAYGWTPDRLFAASAAAVSLGYGVSYAAAVARRAGWMARIRQANIVMALGIVGIAALWLTPVLDPQRIAARDQLARVLDGRTELEKLDLWFMGRELGVAGEAALAELAARDLPDKAAFEERLARLEAATSRWAFRREADLVQSEPKTARLRAQIQVMPAGAEIPERMFSSLRGRDVDRVLEGCERRTPGGHPGCVLVVGEMLDTRAGPEGVLIYMRHKRDASLSFIWPDKSSSGTSWPVFLRGKQHERITPSTIDAVLEGGYEIAPPTVPAFHIGGAEIVIRP